MDNSNKNVLADSMQKRQFALPDGRYLIFYDFPEMPASAPADDANDKIIDEPRPQNEATEEKNV